MPPLPGLRPVILWCEWLFFRSFKKQREANLQVEDAVGSGHLWDLSLSLCISLAPSSSPASYKKAIIFSAFQEPSLRSFLHSLCSGLGDHRSFSFKFWFPQKKFTLSRLLYFPSVLNIIFEHQSCLFPFSACISSLSPNKECFDFNKQTDEKLCELQGSFKIFID